LDFDSSQQSEQARGVVSMDLVTTDFNPLIMQKQ